MKRTAEVLPILVPLLLGVSWSESVSAQTRKDNMKNRPFGQRLGFAVAGIVATWRTEASFRTQGIAAAGAILVLCLLRPSAAWWALVLLTTGLVLAAELFNTALERVIDQLHPEYDPMLKIAKDCAAGAVLILSLTAVLVFAALLVGTWRG